MSKIFRNPMSLLTFLSLLMLASSAIARTPVAMVMEPEGLVEYSKVADRWKKVRRNKMVFSGYQVRTGEDGNAKILNKKSGSYRLLGANSVINIGEEQAELVSGDLGEPVAAADNLLASLDNRLIKAQRYTTVRRSVVKPCNDEKVIRAFKTARNIKLSASHPDLVWWNANPADATDRCTYRLTIGDSTTDIPAGSGDMIRHKLNLEPGEHSYKVEMLYAGEVIKTPKKSGTITWLNAEEQSALDAGSKQIKNDSPDDRFMLANYYDEQGFTVVAMDLYEEFFAENQDENDLRPLLIKAYHDLKLKRLKDKEANTYNQLLEAEG